MKRMAAQQQGLTLIEMLVVVGIIAALVGLGLPAMRALLRSFESEESVRSLVEAALTSARAMAVQQQEYVGVRFQKAYRSEGPMNAPQYMVFVIHDKQKTGLANGFRAVEGIKPVRLPDLFGVMDLTLVERKIVGNQVQIGAEYPVSDDAGISGPSDVSEVTSFSVVFSPSGHLVIHEVRVRNHDGKSGVSTESDDDVFNTLAKIRDSKDPRGMFVQDDYVQEKLGPENSRRSFIVYSAVEFRKAYDERKAWSGYLSRLRPIHIAPLTGTLIGGG